jgi:hypothetical protein
MKLPDFLIIGGMRCGTTSLADLLRGQRKIYLPAVKEIHFFDKRNPDIGTSVHRYSQLFRDTPPGTICGEVTPDYLSTKDCDQFIKQVIPEIKLVTLLRDPVERTWSHYQFSCFHKVESEEFRDALALEPERLEIQSDHTDIFFSYLQRSRYLEHLIRFEQLFGRGQIHVLFLDELVSDPKHTLSRLFQFLGCEKERADAIQLPHANRIDDFYRAKPFRPHGRSLSLLTRLVHRLGFQNADRPPVLSNENRRYLREYFRSHDADLEGWLGRPLPWTGRED